jgi:hypothetical protein
MKNLKFLALVLFTALIVAVFQVAALAQSASPDAKDNLANMSSASSSVKWELKTPHSGGTLTVSAPDGRVFRKEFKAGASLEFQLTDKQGEKLPDGQYTYELRPNPVLEKAVKEKLAAARGKSEEEAATTERDLKKRGLLPSRPAVQSGSFSIVNGSVILAGATEPGQRQVSKAPVLPRLTGAPSAALAKMRQHHLVAIPDQVIPDDLIVQGSICAGFDCVNNENFGFDTIRLKENNTRIQFDDTSVGSFPTNNWQIRANSSASGGESFLGFVDQGSTGNSETGTIVFSVAAGALANSIKVDSSSRVGLRTATPVLDLHINTSNTPAIRLEQNSSGGFTAQTWDIGANEANFFVRDVTSGSRLPFRIRPGAPTSSVDISADGDVGVGTASPQFSSNTAKFLAVEGGTGAFAEVGSGSNQSGTTAVLGTFAYFNRNRITADKRNAVIAGVNDGAIDSGSFLFFTTNAGTLGERMRINRLGQVGIGTGAPDQTLTVNGGASKPGGGSWAVFSDERLKTIKGHFNSGLKAVMQLQPLRYEYKPNNALDIKLEGEQVGFAAQALQTIIPEAVTRNGQGYLMVNNDPILWTMLNAIKEQQNQIAELKKEIRQLRTASRRRR